MSRVAHTERISTSPRPYIIAGGIILGVFILVFGIWAIFGNIQRAVIAPGVLKVEDYNTPVQHLEGGIVDEVFVQDGSHVEVGDTLLTLKSEQVNANVDILQGQLNTYRLNLARFDAERSLSERVHWPKDLKKSNDPGIKDTLAAEQGVFLSKRDILTGQLNLLSTQILQINKQLEGIEDKVAAETEIIAKFDEELDDKRALLKEEFIEKSSVLNLERQLASHKGLLSSAKSEKAQLQERISEIKVRMNELKTQYVQEAVQKYSETQSKLFDIQDRLRPQKDAQKRLKILAPASGTVVNLKTLSEGNVIRPGEALLEVVPAQRALVVECNIRPQDIAKVYEEQYARIELNAFDRRKVQPVDGKVIYVSADSLTVDTPYGRQTSYKAHIELDNDSILAQNLSLTPGMPATAFINTGERTFVDYMLEPFIETFRKALKE